MASRAQEVLHYLLAGASRRAVVAPASAWGHSQSMCRMLVVVTTGAGSLRTCCAQLLVCVEDAEAIFTLVDLAFED